MALSAQVVVEKTSYSFDKPFTYRVPWQLEETLCPGCRVIVPFGGGDHKRQGLVLAVEEQPPQEGWKEISSQVDLQPLLDQELLTLLQVLRNTTFCTYYDALRVLIPAGIGVQLRTLCYLNPLWRGEESLPPPQQRIVDRLRAARRAMDRQQLLRELELPPRDPDLQALLDREVVLCSEGIRQKVGESTIQMAKLTQAYLEGEVLLPRKTPKQRAVLELLEKNGCASVRELAYYGGVTPAVIKNLQKKGVVEVFGRQIFRTPSQAHLPTTPPPVLTPGQQQACQALWEQAQLPAPKPALLYGVTGSGKTQVFLALISRVLGRGQGVIVLVPEISLTPQTVAVFRCRFGDQVAVLHSGLSMGERADEYRRVRQGKARVVVGTRSAVFAPVQSLGLILLDEEQEHTYRSEQSPKYHAREIARWRCRYHGALLLLASATPSLESFYQAQQGRYTLVRLGQRYHGGALPQVTVADMSDHYGALLSPTLADALRENLERGEQSILLLNRRGYHTLVKCQNCGEVATCPHCSVALTYHSANGRLLCHYCGYSQSSLESCPACGSPMLRYGGAGTQKVEELLSSALPQARILRVDMDTTMARLSHQRLFSAFAQGEYDIMVGTQMVAKGHNFPRVTLVGVLNADQILYASDFRGCERAFSLMTQVVGRCGRGDLPGRAVIQTCTPHNPVIHQAARQDYDGFYREEIASRRLGLYPPFCDICLVGFVSRNQDKVREAARRFSQKFREVAAQRYPSLPLRMLEPSEPLLEKVADRHRYRILIKCRQSEALCRLLWELLVWFDQDRNNRGTHISLDMNYDGSM